MADSKRTKLTPYVVLAFLFAVAGGVTRFTGTPTYDPSLPVRSALPPDVGEWRGIGILFCSNEDCARQYTDAQLAGGRTCLACGSRLDEASPGERASLPSDSLIMRRHYANDRGEWVTVAAVISGRQRSSIHRPEWCLPGQGFRIVGDDPFPVLLPPNGAVRAGMLDVIASAGDGRSASAMAYAYWFCSPHHVTSSQASRLAWMMRDSVVRGRVSRWAYVSIVTFREEATSDHVERIRRFLSVFWPGFNAGVAPEKISKPPSQTGQPTSSAE